VGNPADSSIANKNTPLEWCGIKKNMPGKQGCDRQGNTLPEKFVEGDPVLAEFPVKIRRPDVRDGTGFCRRKDPGFHRSFDRIFTDAV
jgi:hypothetical protein